MVRRSSALVPRLRELLGNYREADTVDGIAILARRPL